MLKKEGSGAGVELNTRLNALLTAYISPTAKHLRSTLAENTYVRDDYLLVLGTYDAAGEFTVTPLGID